MKGRLPGPAGADGGARQHGHPCFADSGGPFAGHAGRIEGPAPADAGVAFALATLYCVLTTDYCLEALGARGPITVEGSFTANPWFGPLLAGLDGYRARWREPIPQAGAPLATAG